MAYAPKYPATATPAQKSAKTSWLRRFRTWHKWVGLAVLLLVLTSSVTGVLLAWKKNVDALQPPTRKGTSLDLDTWISVGQTAGIAQQALRQHLRTTGDYSIERIEARPDKGIFKVIFERGYWEVQVDGATGGVLSVARRHSDWIEHVHDGSIINDVAKLVSMNVLGVGLLLLAGTGFWLYYGPKRIRAGKRRDK